MPIDPSDYPSIAIVGDRAIFDGVIPTGGLPLGDDVSVLSSVNSTVAAVLTIPDFLQSRWLGLQVKNTGSAALNAFQVLTRPHPSADWTLRLNQSAHFIAPPPSSFLRVSSGTDGSIIDPTTLGAGVAIDLCFDFTDLFAAEVQFRASAPAATTLSIYWGAT